MASGRVPEDLLQLEVRELTELLRHGSSFGHLRGMLAAKGIPASATVLAGLVEGEDLSSYGVVFTPLKKCVVFELPPDESLIRWDVIDQPRTLTGDFQAVLVAADMVRDGQIS